MCWNWFFKIRNTGLGLSFRTHLNSALDEAAKASSNFERLRYGCRPLVAEIILHRGNTTFRSRNWNNSIWGTVVTVDLYIALNWMSLTTKCNIIPRGKGKTDRILYQYLSCLKCMVRRGLRGSLQVAEPSRLSRIGPQTSFRQFFRQQFKEKNAS